MIYKLRNAFPCQIRHQMKLALCWVLIFAFSISPVQAESLFLQGNESVTNGLNTSGPLNASIPQELANYISPDLARITLYATDVSQPTLYHILDAHGQPDGQRKIAEILNQIKQMEPANTLMLEGGSGPLDANALRVFAQAEDNRKIADLLIDRSWLSGAEKYLSLDSEPMQAEGLEDIKTYRRHIETFRQWSEQTLAREELLEMINAKLSLAEQKTSDRFVRKLMQWLRQSEGGETEFGPSLKELIHLAETKWDLLSEQEDWISLYPNLMPIVLKLQTKGTNEENKSAYEAIKDIDSQAIMQEARELALDLLELYAETDQDRLNAQWVQRMFLVQRLILLKWTRDDYDYWLAHPDLNHPQGLRSLLKGPEDDGDISEIKEQEAAMQVIATAIEFYELAIKRDEVFWKSIHQHVNQQENKIVITGGFHQKEMQKNALMQGWNYVQIEPRYQWIAGAHEKYFASLSGSEVKTVSSSNRLNTEKTSGLADILRLMPESVRIEMGGKPFAQGEELSWALEQLRMEQGLNKSEMAIRLKPYYERKKAETVQSIMAASLGSSSDDIRLAFYLEGDALLPVNTRVLSDQDLVAKLKFLQDALNLKAIRVIQQVPSVENADAEVMLQISPSVRGLNMARVYREHYAAYGNELLILINPRVIDPDWIYSALIHEITEAYHEVKAIDAQNGLDQKSYEWLTLGGSKHAALGYFHWKAYQAEFLSENFNRLSKRERFHLSYQLIDVGNKVLHHLRSHASGDVLADTSQPLGVAVHDLMQIEQATNQTEGEYASKWHQFYREWFARHPGEVFTVQTIDEEYWEPYLNWGREYWSHQKENPENAEPGLTIRSEDQASASSLGEGRAEDRLGPAPSLTLDHELRVSALALAEMLDSAGYEFLLKGRMVPSVDQIKLMPLQTLRPEQMPHPGAVNIAILPEAVSGLELATFLSATRDDFDANIFLLPGLTGTYRGTGADARLFAQAGVFYHRERGIQLAVFSKPMPIHAMVLGGMHGNDGRGKFVESFGVPLLEERQLIRFLNDKAEFQRFMEKEGLPIPPGLVFEGDISDEEIISQLQTFYAEHEVEEIVIKPIRGYGSKDVRMFMPDDKASILLHLRKILTRDRIVLIQKRIANRDWVGPDGTYDYVIRAYTSWNGEQPIFTPDQVLVRYRPQKDHSPVSGFEEPSISLNELLMSARFTAEEGSHFIKDLTAIIEMGARAVESKMLEGRIGDQENLRPGMVAWDIVRDEGGHFIILEAQAGSVGDLDLLESILIPLKKGNAIFPFMEFLRENAQRYREQFPDVAETHFEHLPVVPQDEVIYFNLSQLMFRMAFPSAGLQLLKSAVSINPNYDPANRALGWHFYEQLKQYTQESDKFLAQHWIEQIVPVWDRVSEWRFSNRNFVEREIGWSFKKDEISSVRFLLDYFQDKDPEAVKHFLIEVEKKIEAMVVDGILDTAILLQYKKAVVEKNLDQVLATIEDVESRHEGIFKMNKDGLGYGRLLENKRMPFNSRDVAAEKNAVSNLLLRDLEAQHPDLARTLTPDFSNVLSRSNFFEPSDLVFPEGPHVMMLGGSALVAEIMSSPAYDFLRDKANRMIIPPIEGLKETTDGLWLDQALVIFPDNAMKWVEFKDPIRVKQVWVEAGLLTEHLKTRLEVKGVAIVSEINAQTLQAAMVAHPVGEQTQALKETRQLIDLSDDQTERFRFDQEPTLVSRLAEGYEISGNKKKSLDMRLWALSLKPNEASLWFELGRLFHRYGYDEDAQEAWENAVRLDGDADYMTSIRRDLNEAIGTQHFRRALALIKVWKSLKPDGLQHYFSGLVDLYWAAHTEPSAIKGSIFSSVQTTNYAQTLHFLSYIARYNPAVFAQFAQNILDSESASSLGRSYQKLDEEASLLIKEMLVRDYKKHWASFIHALRENVASKLTGENGGFLKTLEDIELTIESEAQYVHNRLINVSLYRDEAEQSVWILGERKHSSEIDARQEDFDWTSPEREWIYYQLLKDHVNTAEVRRILADDQGLDGLSKPKGDYYLSRLVIEPYFRTDKLTADKGPAMAEMVVANVMMRLTDSHFKNLAFIHDSPVLFDHSQMLPRHYLEAGVDRMEDFLFYSTLEFILMPLSRVVSSSVVSPQTWVRAFSQAGVSPVVTSADGETRMDFLAMERGYASAKRSMMMKFGELGLSWRDLGKALFETYALHEGDLAATISGLQTISDEKIETIVNASGLADAEGETMIQVIKANRDSLRADLSRALEYWFSKKLGEVGASSLGKKKQESVLVQNDQTNLEPIQKVGLSWSEWFSDIKGSTNFDFASSLGIKGIVEHLQLSRTTRAILNRLGGNPLGSALPLAVELPELSYQSEIFDPDNGWLTSRLVKVDNLLLIPVAINDFVFSWYREQMVPSLLQARDPDRDWTERDYDEYALTQMPPDMLNRMIGKIKDKMGDVYEKNKDHILFVQPSTYDVFDAGHPLSRFAMLMIASELKMKERIVGKEVLVLGSGDGLLGRVALKLGASKVILVDNDQGSIEKAEVLMRAEGYEVGKDYQSLAVDFTSPSGQTEIRKLAQSSQVAIFHVGPWEIYGDAYQKGVELLLSMPGLQTILDGGHAVFARDMDRTIQFKTALAKARDEWRKKGFVYSELTQSVDDGSSVVTAVFHNQRAASLGFWAREDELKQLDGIQEFLQGSLDERIKARLQSDDYAGETILLSGTILERMEKERSQFLKRIPEIFRPGDEWIVLSQDIQPKLMKDLYQLTQRLGFQIRSINQGQSLFNLEESFAGRQSLGMQISELHDEHERISDKSASVIVDADLLRGERLELSKVLQLIRWSGGSPSALALLGEQDELGNWQIGKNLVQWIQKIAQESRETELRQAAA